MSNPFDDKIKQTLEGFEMPYDAAAWSQFETQLPAQTTPPASKSWLNWKSGLMIGAVATALVTVAVLSNEDAEPVAEAENVPVLVQQSESSDVANEPELVEGTRTNSTSGNAVQSISSEKDSEAAEQSITATLTTGQPQSNTSEKSSSESPKATPSVPEKPKVQPTESNASNAEKALELNVQLSATKLCVGEDLTALVSPNFKGTATTWNFGDGTTEVGANPSHTYVVPGNYQVTVSGSSGTKQAEQVLNVSVSPSPTAMLTMERKLESFEAIPLYEFNTALQPTETATWKFSDGRTAQGNKVTQLFRDGGKSTVELTVKNQYGCTSSMDSELETEEFHLLTPEAFTPNGDNLNDDFMPEALSTMGVPFTLTIRSMKTGETVYLTRNSTDRWNGQLNNFGTKCEAGPYLWTVVLEADILKNKVFNGTVHLKR